MTFWDMSRVVESKTQNVFFHRSYNIFFYKIDYPQSLSPKLSKKEHSKILLKVFEFSIKKEMELLWVLRRVFEEMFY